MRLFEVKPYLFSDRLDGALLSLSFLYCSHYSPLYFNDLAYFCLPYSTHCIFVLRLCLILFLGSVKWMMRLTMLSAWLKNLRKINIPVLRQTAREIGWDSKRWRQLTRVPFQPYAEWTFHGCLGLLSYTIVIPVTPSTRYSRVRASHYLLGTSNFLVTYHPDLLVDGSALNQYSSRNTFIKNWLKERTRAAY